MAAVKNRVQERSPTDNDMSRPALKHGPQLALVQKGLQKAAIFPKHQSLLPAGLKSLVSAPVAAKEYIHGA